MKDAIFLDADVMLDMVLDRKPFAGHARQVIALCENARVQGFTSSLILANIYYILRKISSHQQAINSIDKVRSILTVLPFTDREIGQSITSGFSDVEDGIQNFIAANNALKIFITRNSTDFKKSLLSVLSPEEYLKGRKSALSA